jgi:hypothetical protein
LFKIIHSTGAKGSTQTNQKNKLDLKRKERKGNQRLPWSGAPDRPVCHRTVSSAPPDSVRCTRANQLELFTFGFLRRSSAIIHRTIRCAIEQCPVHHRTVRCTSGATAICAQRSTLQSEHWNSDVRAASQRGTGLSGATPDCPVRHRTVRCHMRTKPPTVDRFKALTVG